jgi:two-component system phosphate regulon response regulator PhoB
MHGFRRNDDNAMTTTILAVEDEPAIREMIQYTLEREGYDVLAANDVREARETLLDNRVDLAMVDWMLPDTSGLDLIRSMRKDPLTQRLPILVLTARSEDQDIARGLDAGADDYVTKPFSPRELHARIRALLRRSQEFNQDEVINHDQLSIDLARHRVEANGTELSLGHTEFKLLQFLMQNPERVYSRSQLLDHVWGPNTFIEERTIDVHVLRLRKVLKPHALDGLIQTVRGAGYRFSTRPD